MGEFMLKCVVLPLLVVGVIVTNTVRAQDPIPSRPPRGFQPPYIQSDCNAPVEFKAFLDLTCPDCRAAWPVLQQVATHYNQGTTSLLDFEVLLFPLPYHRAAFPAAWTAYILREVEAPKVYTWFDAIFRHQSKFYNNAILSTNQSALYEMLAQDVSENTGVKSGDILAGFNEFDPSLEEAIVMWKYACTRTVSGTPTVFINGIRVDFALTWTLADWQKVIDPLLKQKSMRRTCPAGQPACHYLPGKIECCLKGEACIPNVGCRC